jgi:hypothetical protein
MIVDIEGGGREEIWLPLLRALTGAAPEWTIWKNVESALKGTGDVDSAAPRRAWPSIERTFIAWAAELDLGPVFSCLHIPRTANHFAVLPGTSELLQLEVKSGATYRGSVAFYAEDLLPYSVHDPRGFRKLRPGAEGVLKLLNNGIRRGGLPDWRSLREKAVVDLLLSDPEGVAGMARHFGWARDAVHAAVAAVCDGRWDRRAALTIEVRALAQAVAQPHVVAERLWFRAYRKRTCPVLDVVYRRDRTAPTDIDGWLSEIASDHTVVRPRSGLREP